MSMFDEFPDLATILESRSLSTACQKPALMIAMTPRTGSSHLCAALAAASGIAPPAEIFNPRDVVQYEKKRRGVANFAEYVKSFNEDPGARFVFKTSWQDFALFSPIYRLIFPNLHILYLNRLDAVMQAVSLFRAIASGKWHDDAWRPAAPAADIADQFNLSFICRLIDVTEDEKIGWELFFAREGLTPPRLNYEDFAHDVTIALRFIETRFGLKMERPVEQGVGFRKMADGLNDEWAEKVRYYRSGAFYDDVSRSYQAAVTQLYGDVAKEDVVDDVKLA
jgi:LPS sulfotransferase NodH